MTCRWLSNLWDVFLFKLVLVRSNLSRPFSFIGSFIGSFMGLNRFLGRKSCLLLRKKKVTNMQRAGQRAYLTEQPLPRDELR